MKLNNTSWKKCDSNDERYYSQVEFNTWIFDSFWLEVEPKSNVYSWEVSFSESKIDGLEPDFEKAKKAAEDCVLDLLKLAISDR